MCGRYGELQFIEFLLIQKHDEGTSKTITWGNQSN